MNATKRNERHLLAFWKHAKNWTHRQTLVRNDGRSYWVCFDLMQQGRRERNVRKFMTYLKYCQESRACA